MMAWHPLRSMHNIFRLALLPYAVVLSTESLLFSLLVVAIMVTLAAVIIISITVR